MADTARCRERFLESETNPKFNYERNGFYISKTVCILLIITAVLAAVITGVVTYFIAKEKPITSDDVRPDIDANPIQPQHSMPHRLPNTVWPSYYRLKFIPTLDNGTFTGEVYITLSTTLNDVKEIKLNAESLDIHDGVTLTEQLYENIPIIKEGQTKREINSNRDATLVEDDNIKEYDNNQKIPLEYTTDPNEHSYDVRLVTPKVTAVTRSNSRRVSIASVNSDAKNEQLIITLESFLKPNTEYVLQISFNGTSEGLTGFYTDNYLDSREDGQHKHFYGVTQFEPTKARKAFPCFDEPQYKAKFEISVGHQDHMTALSNMLDTSKEPMSDIPGWSWTHFDRSVKMSTYLVAFCVVDFQYLSTSYVSSDNETKLIRIWARPDKLSEAKYSLSAVPKLLSFYEKLFEIPYTLKKLDLLASPAFKYEGMENWGLILFRERYLLCIEEDDVNRKRSVLSTLAHELAHMWFGNLVTMSWWDDLWLNEGFATYMNFIGTEHINHKWTAQDGLLRTLKSSLKIDALAHTTSQSLHVSDSNDIFDKFNAITYNRAACIIRMLNHTITEPVFYNGIVRYLDTSKFSNTVEDELWQAITEALAASSPQVASELSVAQFMRSWTNQAGAPVVDVFRNRTSGDLTFTQTPLEAERSSASSENKTWSIPITYTTLDRDPASWRTTPQMWLNERQRTINVPLSSTQVLYVNVESVGYYRVNYDLESWKQLGLALNNSNASISDTIKTTLLDDVLNLASLSYVGYELALDFSSFIRNEQSLEVWNMFLINMDFLENILQRTDYYTDFQKYMLHLLQPSLKRYDYGNKKPSGGGEDDELFVDNFVYWECRLGAKRCIEWARGEFEEWTKNNEEIEYYIQDNRYSRVSTVLTTALQYGGVDEFERVLKLYLDMKEPIILMSLRSVRQEHLIRTLLEWSLMDGAMDSIVDASHVWGTRYTSEANYVLRDAFITMWSRIYERFSVRPELIRDIVNNVIDSVGTKAELDTMKKFIEQNYEQLRTYRQVFTERMDKAALRVQWLQKEAPAVGKWLKQYNLEHGLSKIQAHMQNGTR